MSDWQGCTEQNNGKFPSQSSIEVIGEENVVDSIGDGDVDQRVVDKQHNEGGNAEDPMDCFLTVLRRADFLSSNCLEQC